MLLYLKLFITFFYFHSHLSEQLQVKGFRSETVTVPGVLPAIASLLHDDADCIVFLNPLAHTYHKVGQTSLNSKVVKFDHFGIGIVNHLPRTQKLDGVSGTNPVLDDISARLCLPLAISVREMKSLSSCDKTVISVF